MGGRLGAWVAAALAALNITVNSVSAPLTDLAVYLSDPLDTTYTYTEQGLDSYYSNQVIKIDGNTVEIDGSPYYNVWLSHDAAEKFRVNAFDFKTAYSLTSNTNASFRSGTGFFSNNPVFTDGTTFFTQTFTLDNAGTYQIGDISLTLTDYPDLDKVHYLFGSNNSGWISSPISYPYDVRFYSTSSGENKSFRFQFHDSFGNTKGGGSISGSYVNYPFSYDYVSSVIPADQILDPDDGLLIHVPASDGHGNDTPIVQWVNDNPDKVDTDWHIDLPDANFSLDSLIDDVIIPLIPVLKAEFNEAPVTPTPVDPTTIAGTPWITLDNRLQQIIDNIQNFDLSPLTAPLATIINTITSIPGKLDNLISNLTNLGNTILEDIETGPARVWDKMLDILSALLAPFLLLLKRAVGIWHYVVEWFGSISTPFTFFWGVLSGLGSLYTYPIYASIAGFIVIAVYKRFGR